MARSPSNRCAGRDSTTGTPSCSGPRARGRSLNELKSRNHSRVVWAHGNLVELYLLAVLLPPIPDRPAMDQLPDRAVRHAHDLVNRVGADSFEVYSTRRQIVRYIDWYREIADLGDLPAAAQRVFDVLPEPTRQEWD